MSESTGTITVTNGSASVTGSGTLFATNFVSANDILVVDGAMYVVKSVTSDTALTLTQSYAGETASGKSYDIVHLTGEDIVNLLARKVTELVEKYGLTVNSITDTPGAGKIPQADDNGKLADGWLSAAALQEVKVYVDGESDSTIIAATKEGDITIREVTVSE